MNSFWAKYGVSAIAIVFVFAAFFLGIFVGTSQIAGVDEVVGVMHQNADPLSFNGTTADQVDFAPFWRVWNVLDTKFVPRGTSTEEQIEAQEKVWSAIAGLVAAYEDPYTTFFKPEETETFKESARGTFEGVGMVVGIEEGQLVVVAPLEDSPAMKAGVEAGDVIMKIDGVESVSFSTDKAVELIRGEGGTEVVLEISRKGEPEHITIPIIRGKIDIPSTNTGVVSREIKRPKENTDVPLTKEMVDETTGEVVEVAIPVEELPEEAVEVVEADYFFLRLYNFSESSMRSFKKGLEEFSESNTNKLIIDLRGNPGGFLQSAVDMASYFIPEGDVIVREIVGASQDERTHVSAGYDLLNAKDMEVVVLINRGSASASEILAGALQEYGVATIIGEKSFGKGSVQELIDITGDVSLKVTIARWYTPQGVSISEEGLTPDIVVNLTPPLSSLDPIFDAATTFLGSK